MLGEEASKKLLSFIYSSGARRSLAKLVDQLKNLGRGETTTTVGSIKVPPKPAFKEGL